MKKKRRFLWLIIPGVIVAAAVGALFYFRAHPVQTQAAAVDLTSLSTTKIVTGSVSSGISATGTVRTNQTATITWGASGKVSQVLVAKGDLVKADQILAQIDPSSSSSLVTAQANLTSAKQTLVDLQDVTVSQANANVALINAQTAVDDAQTTLDNLKVQPTQSQIDAAYATYLGDVQIVEKLQVAYDKVSGWPETDVRRAQALSDLETAQQTKETDYQYYAYLNNYTPDAATVSQAEANLELVKAQWVVAQADYDAVKDGPDQAKIAAAEANIQEIEATIDQQYIRAPFDGTITSVSVKEGDLVNNGTTAFSISDMATLYIDLQVSEVDINSVQVGQTVDLTYDAIADKTYKADVTDIGMIGTVSGGVANFTVTALLSDADSSVHPGMTASASIITQEANDVLLVPNNAIATLGRNKVIYILADSQLTPVTVTVGLASDTQTEVTADSLAVDDLVVTNPSALTSSASSSASTSIFGNLFQMLGVTTSGGNAAGGFGGAGGPPAGFDPGSIPSGGFDPGNLPSGGGGNFPSGAPSGSGG